MDYDTVVSCECNHGAQQILGFMIKTNKPARLRPLQWDRGAAEETHFQHAVMLPSVIPDYRRNKRRCERKKKESCDVLRSRKLWRLVDFNVIRVLYIEMTLFVFLPPFPLSPHSPLPPSSPQTSSGTTLLLLLLSPPHAPQTQAAASGLAAGAATRPGHAGGVGPAPACCCCCCCECFLTHAYIQHGDN